MAIKVITGQPRHGKSQFEMSRVVKEKIKYNDELEKEGKPRRKIYIDIDGVNADDTETHLPDCITDFERDKIWFGVPDDPDRPDDFWCPEEGAEFVFDECHKRPWCKDGSGSVSKNPTTISLNEHGHAGHNIDLLTQFPNYIHTHIRGLVETHWHVKRKFGLPLAKIYKWDEFILNPRADKNIKESHEVITFFYRKKWQNTYKSASAHAPMPIKIPPKIIFALMFVIGFAYYINNASKDSVILGGITGNDDAILAQSEEVQNELDSIKSQNQQQLEEINNVRLELEELKSKYLPKHIATLAAYEDVRPAMVISNSNGGCVAYNSFGEPLLLTDSLCYDMDNHPALIPKSRSLNQVSDTLPQANNGINENSPLSTNNLQVDEYSSPKPYSY